MLKEIKHKTRVLVQWRLVYAYTLMVVLSYIYFYHVVCIYGDFIDALPKYDVLGESKCVIQIHGCDRQIIDGWTLIRGIFFVLIGFSNPHSHANIAALSILMEAFSVSCKRTGLRPLINPLTNLIGYSIGSYICDGGGLPPLNTPT